MYRWILDNALPLGLSALLTAIVCSSLHILSVNAINASHALEIKNQAASLNAQCEAAKKVTEDISYGYQKQLAARDAALANARRLLNKQCTAPVVVDPPGGYNGTTGTGEFGLQNDQRLRADANELLAISGDGEKYRLQLIGCQDLVNKNRSARLSQ